MSAPHESTGDLNLVSPVEVTSDSGATSRSPTNSFRALFNGALELLARREHSCHELRQKLTPKFPEADFDAVLQRLQEFNYQSDQRFAEVFCRSRVQRGQGPLRIRQELQLRGIQSELAQSTMDQLQESVDWFELALDRLRRKYRRPIDPALPREQQMKERARRQRHLAYRGFFSDAIQFALTELDTELKAAENIKESSKESAE